VAVSRLVIIDRDAMPVESWVSLLSIREHAEVLTYSQARRQRSVASRVLVKYLTVSDDSSAFREVGADHINRVSPDELASVEVLSGSARMRRASTVSRAGSLVPDHAVSAAHCGKYTAAAQSPGRMGIDLERIETRRPEFYQQMFSSDDRDWAEGQAHSEGASRDAAFTLLWCVKEAYLKASGHSGLSVWNFSRWSVRLGQGVSPILQLHPTATAVAVAGGIDSEKGAQRFGLNARRLGDMLLVAVQCWTDSDETGKGVL
jgi:phosphopantetheinyl transferase (holo-ACP synthase)